MPRAGPCVPKWKPCWAAAQNRVRAWNQASGLGADFQARCCAYQNLSRHHWAVCWLGARLSSPSLRVLVAVLQFFSVSCCRCAKTYGNYLSYARVGCLICRQPDAVFKEDVLKRARVAIQKQLLFVPRPKMWIRLSVLQRMVPLMIESPLLRTTIAWILTSYAFMLRRVFIAFAALGRLP